MEKITFPIKCFPNEVKVYKYEWLRIPGNRPRLLFFVTDQVSILKTFLKIQFAATQILILRWVSTF